MMETTERIVLQAVEMFINSGIKAITMDDIARATGVSKRTIYENFRDKDELLRNCIEFIDREHKKEISAIIEKSENTIKTIFVFLEFGINSIKTINPLFISDLKKYHFKIWQDVYLKNVDRHLDKSFTLLKKGMNEGLVRKNINIEIVSVLLNQQLIIMSDEQIFPSGKFSRTEVFENILINFIRGIATRKGIEVIEDYTKES